MRCINTQHPASSEGYPQHPNMEDEISLEPRDLGRALCIITGASKGFGRTLAFPALLPAEAQIRPGAGRSDRRAAQPAKGGHHNPVRRTEQTGSLLRASRSGEEGRRGENRSSS